MNNLNVTNSTPLKPCPFCGGDAELLDWEDGNCVYVVNWAVNCVDCGVEMPSHPTEKEAIEVWNKRHEQQ